MVAEEEDRLRVDHLFVRTDVVAPEDGRHRRHVLMAEADIGPDEAFIARLDVWYSDAAGSEVGHPVPRDDLLRQRHRALCRRHHRHFNEPLQPGHVVVEQSAVLDDPAGNAALAFGEDRERDRLTPTDPLQQREVGAGEDAEVLAVLPIDAFDVLGEHQPDPSHHLGVGRLLPARTLPSPLAAHRHHETAVFHRSAGDGKLLSRLEAQVGKFTKGLVVVVADVGRRDFIGGDIVAQLELRRPR